MDVYRETWLRKRPIWICRRRCSASIKMFLPQAEFYKGIFTAINLGEPLISLTSTRQLEIGNHGAMEGFSSGFQHIKSCLLIPVATSRKEEEEKKNGKYEKWTSCRLRKPNFSFTKGGLYCVRSARLGARPETPKTKILALLPHSSWECHYVNEAIHNITNTWSFVCLIQWEASFSESFRCAPHLLSLGSSRFLTWAKTTFFSDLCLIMSSFYKYFFLLLLFITPLFVRHYLVTML